MAAPSTMIYYPTYELIRDKLAQKYDSPYVPGIAGGISRGFFLSFFELIISGLPQGFEKAGKTKKKTSDFFSSNFLNSLFSILKMSDSSDKTL